MTITNTGTNADIFNALWDAPASTRGFLSFKDDGTLSFNGLQHNKATLIGSNTVPGLGTVVTVHEEGGTYWAGRGSKGYSPASVQTVLLDESASRFGVRYVRLSSVTLPSNAEARAIRNLTITGYLFPTTDES